MQQTKMTTHTYATNAGRVGRTNAGRQVGRNKCRRAGGTNAVFLHLGSTLERVCLFFYSKYYGCFLGDIQYMMCLMYFSIVFHVSYMCFAYSFSMYLHSVLTRGHWRRARAPGRAPGLAAGSPRQAGSCWAEILQIMSSHELMLNEGGHDSHESNLYSWLAYNTILIAVVPATGVNSLQKSTISS